MGEVEGKGARFSRERRLWMVLSAVLLTVLGIVLFQYVRCGGQLAAAKREGEILQEKFDALPGSSLSNGGIAHLNKQDISRLKEALTTDLMQHRELIPYEGVMGGTMGFYSQKDIHVLTSRWVLASFEDGHIGGHMLLEYAVAPGGKIQWKVISAHLD